MNTHFKNIVATFFIGTIVFLIGTYYFNDFKFVSAKDLLVTFGFYQLYAFVLGFGNAYFFYFLNRRKWKPKEERFRFFIGFLGSFFITISGLVILRMITFMVYQNKSVTAFFSQERWQNYIFGAVVTLIIVLIYHLIYFYKEFQQNQLKKQKLLAENASAKFDALKNQLDPHFLFNSLNVLTSLIDENPKQAQKFTTELSKVYRYVLEQKNKDLVPLHEELTFAKTYMSLLKMRFEDSISCALPDCNSNSKAKVVPLSLQLLLENAVKHNEISCNNPLKIDITIGSNFLKVENNLQPKQILNTSSGVGLNNIKQRYKLITNAAFKINQTQTHFAVSIPLLFD